MKVIKIVSQDALMQNSYVICTNNTTILIDCGATLKHTREEFSRQTNGLDLPKIDAILLTHCHFDHICGLKEFDKTFACPIYIKKGFASYISSPLYNASFMCHDKLTYQPKLIKEITETPFMVGDIKIMPIFTPGHTSCSVCYKIDDIIFTGDTLFYLGVGRCDLPSGNNQELNDSLNKLATIDYSLAYPGHGIPFTKP